MSTKMLGAGETDEKKPLRFGYSAWLRNRTCARKKEYATYQQARRACAMAELDLGKRFRFYECPFCTGYHVTSSQYDAAKRARICALAAS